jgi:hypothetical protein
MLLKQKEKAFLLCTQYVGASGQIYVENISQFGKLWESFRFARFEIGYLDPAARMLQPASLLK